MGEGSGDAVRVSLATEQQKGIPVAHDIRRPLVWRMCGVTFVSCPSCGCVEIDVVKIANEVEKRLAQVRSIFYLS